MSNVQEIHGDIVEDTYNDFDGAINIVVLQCNLYGLYGGDVWKHMEYRYPFIRSEIWEAYEEYVQMYNLKSWDMIPPGQMLPITIENLRLNSDPKRKFGRKLCCLFTPLLITNDNYIGWNNSLKLLTRYVEKMNNPDITIGFPVGIGCGLNGGSWDNVQESILLFANNVKNPVYLIHHLDSTTAHLQKRPINLMEATRATDVLLR